MSLYKLTNDHFKLKFSLKFHPIPNSNLKELKRDLTEFEHEFRAREKYQEIKTDFIYQKSMKSKIMRKV